MSHGFRMSGRREVLVVPQPLLRMPKWLVAASIVVKLTVKVAHFLLVRHPAATAGTVTLLWLWSQIGTLGLGVLVVVFAIGAGVWRWRHQRTFTRYLALPVLGLWRRVVIYRPKAWTATMVACGLGKKHDQVTAVPVLRRVVCTEATDRLVVRMLRGQNPDHFHAAVTDLAYAFGARVARIYEARPDARPVRASRYRWLRPVLWTLRQVDAYRWADRPAEVHLVITRRDPLAAIVRPLPMDEITDLTSLPLAVTATLDTFRFCLIATHLLVVGASRRGKGSVFWSLIRALAPAVHSGLVQLWVIDPKGGMELAFGKPMFTRFAHTSFAEMAEMLDEAVAVMAARQLRLAGEVRVHTPRVEDPLIVVMIDEIAALTSYLKDAELRKRIEGALGLLLSQGAGVGVLVAAALQDPRKETLPARDLFLSRILLGVTDPGHVNMALGDGARQAGALADKLDVSAKGVGYVFVEGTAEPVKVRFSYLTDADIRAMAAAYPAPVRLDIPAIPTQPTRAGNGDAPLLPTKLLGYLGGGTNGHRVNGGESR